MESENTGSPFERGGIVTARGTGDGLTIRIDGRVDQIGLKDALREFMSARRGFLSGHEVMLEWVGAEPGSGLVEEVSGILLNEFGVTMRTSRLAESVIVHHQTGHHQEGERGQETAEITEFRPKRRFQDSESGGADSGRTLSLFDGIQSLGLLENDSAKASPRPAAAAVESSFWDDANARIIYTTLRSGQKIETEHSLIVYGDVNSGAEVVAGGDIVVLGSLRGVAHAGAYDETGGGRAIFALNLQPTQLRIGTVISRGSAEGGQAPEIARIDGNIIVVEPYQAKSLGGRKKV